MGKSVKDILAKASAQIGIEEKPVNSNNVKYNTAYYGKTVSGASYSWCCAFVWWVFKECKASSLFFDGKKTAYCPSVEAWAKKEGIWSSKGEPGDLALFDFSGKGIAAHIGIVKEKLSSTTYSVIEGNTSTSSNDNGGKVMLRNRNKSVIRGFVNIKYVKSAYKPSRTITYESPSTDIKWLQDKLNKCLSNTNLKKLDNNKLIEDGAYGKQTSVAVKLYWKQLDWGISSPDSKGYYCAGGETIDALFDNRKK